MPQHRPRWGLRILAIVLSVLLLVTMIAWGSVPRDRIAPSPVGSLRVAEQARGEFRAGKLSVHLDDKQLRVSLAEQPVWESDPGAAFVTAVQGALDVTEHRGYFWVRPKRAKVHQRQSIDAVAVEGDVVQLTGAAGEMPLHIDLRAEGDSVEMHAQVPEADALNFVTGRSHGAAVHGMGEQFQPFDLSGQIFPLINREQGVGRGQQPLTFLADLTNKGAGANRHFSYAAWPSFVTADLRGVQLLPDADGTDAITIADATRTKRVALEIWHEQFTAQLTQAATPKELIVKRHINASSKALPQWATSGAIVGVQGGSHEVRRKVKALLDAGAELSGVWIQDWVGRRTTSFGDRLWWTWQLDQQRYPDWEQLVAELRAQGIRTTTYVNPFIVDVSQRPDAGSVRNLFAEADNGDHLVRDADGEILLADQGEFSAAMIDLSKRETRRWYAEVIAREVLRGGVEGFMADFAEGPPPHAVTDGGSGLEVHNAWAGWWAQTVEMACTLAGKDDCLTWFRAASASSSQHANLFWNGDQMVNFSAEDGLASVLTGTFSAGVSGLPLTHADVGGYTSINAVMKNYVREPELLARWGELAAFGVVMRTHEGNRPAENRQVYDADQAAAFAHNSKMFAALRDYRESIIHEALTTGVPAIRHAWVEAPGSAAAKFDSQFFFGPNVFVAPVLQSGVTEVAVTLPPGQWIHLCSGDSVSGDQRIKVAAPVGQPAAFVRAESEFSERLVREFSALK